jgi:hypothetical protein
MALGLGIWIMSLLMPLFSGIQDLFGILELLPLISIFYLLSYFITFIEIIFAPFILIFEIFAYFYVVLRWDEEGAIVFLFINGLSFFVNLFLLFTGPIYLVVWPIGWPILLIGGVFVKIFFWKFVEILSFNIILISYVLLAT